MLQVIVMLGAFAAAVIVVLGMAGIKAYSRSVGGQPRVPEEVNYRLERIEQAIEAMAIEIERISEGQRFTTRLLSEAKTQLEPVSSGGAPPALR